jgi:hypothetical protein
MTVLGRRECRAGKPPPVSFDSSVYGVMMICMPLPGTAGMGVTFN